jgi:hypothetical protein
LIEKTANQSTEFHPFTPALRISKAAFFLTTDNIREFWVVPITFVIVTLMSGLAA